MRPLNFKPILFVGLLFYIFTGPLQAQFSISGEFRPRLEYHDGYSKLGDSSSKAYPTITGRNRLIFDYSNDPFTVRFSMQQAYIFGENNYGSDTMTRNTINIHEAWFRYAFVKGFAIKIGRSELVYDDGRLLGNSNWSSRATSHDVAIFQWDNKSKGYRGDFGFAINNTAPMTPFLVSYPLKNYKYMAYLYEQKKMFQDKLTISLLGILDVFQRPNSTLTTQSTVYNTFYVIGNNHDTIGTTVIPTTTKTTMITSYPTQLYGRFTIGGTVGYSFKNLKAYASGYYQCGHFNDGRKLNAGFFGGYASYQIVKPLNFLLGYDYLSGNNYSDTEGLKTKSTAFSTLYSTSHGFYGYMDMFSSAVTSGNSAGLTDLYMKATLKFNEKASVEATYRFLGLAQGYLPASVGKPGDLPYVNVEKHLGSEIDLMVLYKPVKNFEINAAYCFFLPTETMERFNGLKPGTGEMGQYAYIMLTYKPTFFTAEKH